MQYISYELSTSIDIYFRYWSKIWLTNNIVGKRIRDWPWVSDGGLTEVTMKPEYQQTGVSLLIAYHWCKYRRLDIGLIIASTGEKGGGMTLFITESSLEGSRASTF